jgi:hypothetical protein
VVGHRESRRRESVLVVTVFAAGAGGTVRKLVLVNVAVASVALIECHIRRLRLILVALLAGHRGVASDQREARSVVIELGVDARGGVPPPVRAMA